MTSSQPILKNLELLNEEIGTIKIDCIFDFNQRKEANDKWITEIGLIVQTNLEKFSNAKALLLLIEHKSTGIIQDFVKRTTWKEELHGGDLFDQIINVMYMMFLGLDFLSNKDQENQKLLEKARQTLNQSQLYDICLLDDFTCLFEQNLYKLNTGEYHSWIEVYLMKIPIVGEKAKERWNKEKNDLTKHSLSFDTRIVKEEITVYFEQRQLQKFNKSCCNKVKSCCKKLIKHLSFSVIKNISKRNIKYDSSPGYDNSTRP